MLILSFLLLCFLGGNLCMECGSQKASYATCVIDSESGLKGTIDFAELAPLGCFGPHNPIEVMVSLTGFKTDDENTKHALIVKEYGDLANGCDATGPIFRAHDDPKAAKHRRRRMADTVPTGFLGNYEEGSKAAFKVQSIAQLRGQNTIIGRTLIVNDRPYASGYKPLGCCVIGVAAGSRFAGMPKPVPQQQPHTAFSFKPPSVRQPAIRSASFFKTHDPFQGRAPKSLPFTAHDDPKPANPHFSFNLDRLHNLGSAFDNHDAGSFIPSFGNKFGGGSSKLRPSISHLDKPPAPPRFPGKVHDGGSPLFGDFGDHSSGGKDFGFDLDSIGLSESEKYIPHEGEETHPDDEGYDSQGGQGKSPDSDRSHTDDGGYGNREPSSNQGYSDKPPHASRNPDEGYSPEPKSEHSNKLHAPDQDTGYSEAAHAVPHTDAKDDSDYGTPSKSHNTPSSGDEYSNDPNPGSHVDPKDGSRYDANSVEPTKAHTAPSHHDPNPVYHADHNDGSNYGTPSGDAAKPHIAPSHGTEHPSDHYPVPNSSPIDETKYAPSNKPQYSTSEGAGHQSDPHDNPKDASTYDTPSGDTSKPYIAPIHDAEHPSGHYPVPNSSPIDETKYAPSNKQQYLPSEGVGYQSDPHGQTHDNPKDASTYDSPSSDTSKPHIAPSPNYEHISDPYRVPNSAPIDETKYTPSTETAKPQQLPSHGDGYASDPHGSTHPEDGSTYGTPSSDTAKLPVNPSEGVSHSHVPHGPTHTDPKDGSTYGTPSGDADKLPTDPYQGIGNSNDLHGPTHAGDAPKVPNDPSQGVGYTDDPHSVIHPDGSGPSKADVVGRVVAKALAHNQKLESPLKAPKPQPISYETPSPSYSGYTPPQNYFDTPPVPTYYQNGYTKPPGSTSATVV